MQDEPAIFISYRRRDAVGHGRALHEYLSGRFGDDHVFFDRSTIESGDVFPDKLRWGVEGCVVLLALIGPEWLDVRGDNGGRRLDDADDFVRREIALALERGKKVIPVLFDDTPIPPGDRLPDPLKALASCDALTLRGKTYEYQTQRRELVRLLAKVPGVPQPLPEPEPDSNRQRMLAKVRRDWIDGYLKHSLDNLARIELGLEEKPDAVSRPWDLIVQQPDRARPLPPGQSMAAAFDELSQALLILGAPGSGKTTLLLELARDLLDRAMQDATHLIPVVFHLSSWATRRRPLADWLVDELAQRYYVPRKLAKAWTDTEQILPLLDGLDEVAPEHREACVEAINAFRRQHPLVPLAVCSRAAEYEALPARMELSGAIVIQPLSRAQIRTYLKQAGRSLDGVRAALRDDDTLWELLETPLMLSIVTLAYQGRSAAEVRALGSLEEWRSHLFANYTQRMFERRTKVTAYTQEQTLRWLSWLARSLVRNNLSVFYLEWTQPDWLQSRAHQSILVIMSIITAGLVVGLLHGLAGGVVATLVYPLPDGVVGNVVGVLTTALGFGVIGLIVGLGGALVGGPIYMLGVRLDKIEPAEAFRWSWKKALRSCRRWLVFGLVLGLIMAVVALVGALLEPPEGVPLAALLGIALGIAPIWGVSLGIPLGLVGALVGGFTSDQIVARAIPNEGIRRSLRNAFVSYVIGGLIGGMVGGLVGLLWGLIPPDVRKVMGESPALESPALALALGLGWIVGLISGLRNGGFAYVKHYVLRFLLWRNDYAPWNYVRFLDYAAERVFLRKVGGGYIFTHRLLMEYFATLQPTDQARQPQTA